MGPMLPDEQPGTWRPVLEGPVAERAREAVRGIADGLDAVPPLRLGDPRADPRAFGASLAGGRAGLAVFYAYLARAWSDRQAAEKASRLLDEAIDAMAQVEMDASLYAGFPGIVWAAGHLSADQQEPEGEDPNQAVDQALTEFLGQSPWQGDYDLIRGLVGLGVYALEPAGGKLRVTARGCLERVIDRLDETAERTSEGITWLTKPELLPPQQRQACPQGNYNLGVAHGVAGVIAMLAQASAAEVGRAKVRPLLDGAVAWLLAQKLPDSPGATFPAWVGPGIEATATRSAWCYGDPGIAATLLHRPVRG